MEISKALEAFSVLVETLLVIASITSISTDDNLVLETSVRFLVCSESSCTWLAFSTRSIEIILIKQSYSETLIVT